MHGTFLSQHMNGNVDEENDDDGEEEEECKKTYNIKQQIESPKPKTNTTVTQFTYCSCSYYSNIIVNI